MSIRAKLILQLLVSSALFVALILVGYFFDRTNYRDQLSYQKGLALEIHVESMSGAASDFQLTKNAEFREEFNEKRKLIEAELAALSLNSAGEIDLLLQEAKASLESFSEAFEQLFGLREEIGLTPRSGLYGQLRKAVHQVEEKLYAQQNYALVADTLQLRRAEKDFMLRNDKKYLAKFKKGMNKLKQNLLTSGIDENLAASIRSDLDVYERTFTKLVTTEEQIGLDASSGVRKTFSTEQQRAMEKLKALEKAYHEKSNRSRSLFTKLALVLTILLLGLLITFTLLNGRSITIRVNTLQSVIGRIVGQRDLSLRAEVSGTDEISKISHRLNELLDIFQELLKSISSSSHILDEAVESLAGQTEETHEGAHKQLTETELVATATTEMGQAQGEIANNTEVAARHVEDTFQDAQLGAKEVDNSIQHIRSLSKKLNMTTDAVKELNEHSGTIGSMVDVIRDIADQTNLLALNAAIEAARAGELGRGFAVVADEVRNLANRTQNSTEEISQIIDTIQSGTGRIDEMMNECKTSGAESAELAATVGEVLQRVLTSMSGIVDMNTQIASATEEQSQVSGEVTRHVQMIHDVAMSTQANTERSVEAVEQVRSEAVQLKEQVNQFKV